MAKRTIFLWLLVYVVGWATASVIGFDMVVFTIAWIMGGMAVYVVHPKKPL